MGKPASHLGAARRLWRILHSAVHLRHQFWKSALVPNSQHAHHLHGYPRFQYAGFSFLLVDPYPEYWAEDWYATDDVYIDYDNYDHGYYLYNRRYPDVRLAITVEL